MQSKISPVIIKNSKLVTEEPNDDYYYVRHNGEWVNIKDVEGLNFGAGDNPLAGAITTGNGDKLYRHKSNFGSVLVSELWVNGIFVFDAKFRKVGAFTSSSTGISNSNILSSLMPDKNTSEYNSKNWRTDDKCTAAIYCSQFSVDGKQGSLPNLQILQKIWMNRTYIDQNDPTVADYPDYALNDWFYKIGNSGAWSSTYFGTKTKNSEQEGNVNGFDLPGGSFVETYQRLTYGIIPIVEL